SPAESASEVDSLASRRMSRSASTDRGLPRLSKALSRRVVYSCAGLLMHTMLRRNPPLLKGSRHRGSRHGGRGSAALEADPLGMGPETVSRAFLRAAREPVSAGTSDESRRPLNTPPMTTWPDHTP